MKSVFVNEITAEWLEQELPAVAAALREKGAEPVRAEAKKAADQRDKDVADARDGGATAERGRILGIEAAALPGQEELAAKLKADPTMTIAAAQGTFLEAEKAKRKAHLSALRKDEADLDPPAPGTGDEKSVAEQVKEVAGLAERSGVIQKR